MLKVLSLITFILVSVNLFASENIEIFTFKEIGSKIEKLGKKYGNENVLLAFDIDCTLLSSSDNFGGDLWYDWQADLMKHDKNSPNLITKDFNKMLFYQSIFQQLATMYPTEKDIPSIMKKFQANGFKTLLLTARGYNIRNLTEVLLKDNDLNMKESCFSIGFPGEYTPFNIDEPEKYGLTADDVKKFDLGKARAVSFFNGMFMSAGQNKGIMLKTLLFKTNKKFKAIVLVDDSAKNVKNMQTVYEGSDVNVYTFRYAFDDSLKRQFEQSDKVNCIRQWKVFKKANEEIFGAK
jgi:hypothetical protein